ncbi:exported hypothetical protein [Bosea sp. 62]|nr:exported hypothetical protein [Bosea sp. 21B]CAD5247437.1 exported hypothetical protein [Bosea sp. 7B]VVT50594.1 exported hypothetical protein [Bosea sp. EC-HK365B]VXA99179.1 exported hypothetical protein [Bosea sp. 127]VXC01803.1 exported hypothetical protein [Bosea sp. 62]VXC45517.1 exported hypothetical protein [Bosea sp. 125]
MMSMPASLTAGCSSAAPALAGGLTLDSMDIPSPAVGAVPARGLFPFVANTRQSSGEGNPPAASGLAPESSGSEKSTLLLYRWLGCRRNR